MFVQISRGHNTHKRENKEKARNEEEETDVPEEVTSPTETSEEFSNVDLSTSYEVDATKPPSRSDQFMNRLKKSSVGKMFKSNSKDHEISIYTIDQAMGKSNREENLTQIEINSKLRRNAYEEEDDAMEHNHKRSVASQANPHPPYRLFFLPPNDWKQSRSKVKIVLKLLLCQCSLACILLTWLISTALLLYLTEGPYEKEMIENLSLLENSTMVSLATDLRILEDGDWDETLIKYMEKHREEILLAVKEGYSYEAHKWTFPGSVLSAVSIITTLGLAAPLPMTFGGKIGAGILTCIGLPLHFIFILHLGRTIAIKIQLSAKEIENKFEDLRQRIINVRRFGEDRKRDAWPEKMFMVDFVPPPWLSFFPFLSYFLYYLLGLLVFGLARNLPTSEMFIFFIDFSQGAYSNGFSRMGYSWYLEGLAILTGINVAIVRDASMPEITSLLQPHGFLTNSIE